MTPPRLSLDDLQALERQRRPRRTEPPKTAEWHVDRRLKELDRLIRACSDGPVVPAIRELEKLRRDLEDLLVAEPNR
jgi:hypothetical protein